MRTAVCATCGKEKENINHTYCKKCARERDRNRYTNNSIVHKRKLKSASKYRKIHPNYYNGTETVRRKYNRMLWEIILSGLNLNKCTKCGYDMCTAALDFHHFDPNKKEFNLARLRSGAPTAENVAKLKEESRKGYILCANCHRELHWGILPLINFYKENPIICG